MVTCFICGNQAKDGMISMPCNIDGCYGIYVGEVLSFASKNSKSGVKGTTSFAYERSKSDIKSTRYGKDILDNFNVDTDLVVWDINNEFDQVVTFSHPEVIGRCPVSGYPDTYKAKFTFVTDKLTMELKAFKLWLNSYYSKQVSHEYLGQEIFSIFWKRFNQNT